MILRRITGWPRWDWTSPFDQMEHMRRQLDNLSEGLTRGVWRDTTAGVFPMVNVTEDQDKYYLRAELPGLKADELDISVTADTISISGERRLPIEDEMAQYHRREREAGRFSRIISLPTQMATDKVEASCADGLITVTLPKAEAAKPKQIKVKTS